MHKTLFMLAFLFVFVPGLVLGGDPPDDPPPIWDSPDFRQLYAPGAEVLFAPEAPDRVAAVKTEAGWYLLASNGWEGHIEVIDGVAAVAATPSITQSQKVGRPISECKRGEMFMNTLATFSDYLYADYPDNPHVDPPLRLGTFKHWGSGDFDRFELKNVNFGESLTGWYVGQPHFYDSPTGDFAAFAEAEQQIGLKLDRVDFVLGQWLYYYARHRCFQEMSMRVDGLYTRLYTAIVGCTLETWGGSAAPNARCDEYYPDTPPGGGGDGGGGGGGLFTQN